MSRTQSDWDRYFLKIAEITAQQSYDIKTKVGTIIARDDQILSYSYNGTPPGWSNTMRDDQGKTLPEVIHAEAYAIAKLARSNNSSEGSTLYCTLSPCIACVKLIIAAGISRVVYRDTYKCQDGITLLCLAGVEATQYAVEGGMPRYRCLGHNHSKLADPKWLAQTGLLN